MLFSKICDCVFLGRSIHFFMLYYQVKFSGNCIFEFFSSHSGNFGYNPSSYFQRTYTFTFSRILTNISLQHYWFVIWNLKRAFKQLFFRFSKLLRKLAFVVWRSINGKFFNASHFIWNVVWIYFQFVQFRGARSLFLCRVKIWNFYRFIFICPWSFIQIFLQIFLLDYEIVIFHCLVVIIFAGIQI